MSKKGPLGKVEKFYIENNYDKTIEDLAKDLNRAKSAVKAYWEKCERKSKNIDVTTESKNPTHIASQIPSSRGSTVMTENGSMLSDDYNYNSSERKRPACTVPVRSGNG
jgi:hypothetical protein